MSENLIPIRDVRAGEDTAEEKPSVEVLGSFVEAH